MDVIERFFKEEYISFLLEFSKDEAICFLDKLYDTSDETIQSYFDFSQISDLKACEIPQFSNFENGTTVLVKHLRMSGNYGVTFEKLGQYLLGMGRKKGAYIKYGENHAKLGEMFQLTMITNSPRTVYLTPLGYAFEQFDEEKQTVLLHKLAFKLTIVQHCINIECFDDDSILQLLKSVLSDTTALRRKTNVRKILNIIGKREWG